ncbi:MAG: phosphatase [Eubacteriales bacterium]|nr:phosphatase [Eubacteriales bacterium]
MYHCDMHTHTIASGHGTSCTITDMAKAAAAKRIEVLGITDHGPATRAAGTLSYFRSLANGPAMRQGVRLCYGAEVNIVDYCGTIDIPEEVLDRLDYAIASVHYQNLKPGCREANTMAYTLAMRHKGVRIIGHPDDTRYPLDYDRLTEAAAEYGVILEVNNSSLSPEGYRGDVRDNYRALLEECRKKKLPVLLSSDSHGTGHIGDFTWAERMVRSVDFPEELILNGQPERLFRILHII